MQNVMTTPMNRKAKDPGQKPRVVVPIIREEFDQFLRPHVEGTRWPFELEVIQSEYETEDLIRTLNDSGSEVMLTAWSTKRLPEDILEQVPSLRYVAHVCGAVCGIISRGLIEQGLLVTNWGNCAARTVAEHCLMQVMACLRKVTKWQLDMHTRQGWKPVEYNVMTLFNKRVGIHGFGASAREFVKLVRPFQCQISTFSPHVSDEILEEYGVARAMSLRELFGGNEIIVDLAALTTETRGSVTQELLERIPQDGVFVNSARGAVVDEAALVRVARQGRIQIALDVYEVEPLPENSPLRGLDNVFLTPHIAGPTIDERKVCGLYALNNVKAYFENKPLQAVIGLDEYDRMT